MNVARRRPGVLCVYAVTRRPARVGGRGPGGERLAVLPAGPFVAIVALLPRLPQASAAQLRHYDAVVRHLWSRFPAVLPARFGTCFGSTADLALALASRARAIARDLTRVRSRAQMTIRIVTGSGLSASGRRAPAAVKNPDAIGPWGPQPAGQASGADYLRGRAALAASERDVPGFAPLRHSVRRWLREERVEKHGAVTSVYHLVPRSSVEAYRRAIERAAAAAGLSIVISGPHPPYAFS